MFHTTAELFLHTYFLLDETAGKLVGDSKLLFQKLYAVFLLPERDADALYALTQREEVRRIDSYDDYARVCRIREYAALADTDVALPAELDEIVSIKGEALREARRLGCEVNTAATETAVCKALTESANTGLTVALCTLGFLQCEGIYVERNARLGVKNLERAARWNFVEGILFALYYGDNRLTNMERLYTVTRGTLYEEIYEAASKAYGIDGARILPESKMLQKAFGAGILKPEIYTSQYSRFIFSPILTLRDKERALFSGHREIVAETADLPLKLCFGELAFDPTAIACLPLAREQEKDEVRRLTLNADMRGETAYRPVCLSADSQYLLSLYMKAMGKAFPSAHIERIDVADLNGYDFEPTRNNVFVRGCDEDRQNVYLLYFKGVIDDGVMNAVKKFLQSDKRKSFGLQHPAAVLDLSPVLPICFCDTQNARLLRLCCDVIALAPVGEAEKSELLAYLLQAKAVQYKMQSVRADGEVLKMLAQYPIDRAEEIVDRAVRFHRGEDAFVLTAQIVTQTAAEDTGERTRYGFGGADNESK